MLDFIIVGLPRSGTTWAANWLTTERTFCAHDPLWTMHYSELDARVTGQANGRRVGVSCTLLWRWPDWLNAHPARKLVVHRDVNEVRESLRRIRIPASLEGAEKLKSIDGRHVAWTDLFDATRAADLWDWLTAGLPFDAQRHADLVQMRIEPQFRSVRRDWRVNRRLAAELGA